MIPRWIVARIKISRWIVTPGLDSTLNCYTKLNCDLGLGSQFNVEFWPGVIIQREIWTRGHNSTWNSDPSTRGIATQEGVKIQQRDQYSTAT